MSQQQPPTPNLDYLQYWSKLIVEGVEEALFSLDTEWRFTYINQQAARLWNRSVETLLGKVIWEEFPALLNTNLEQFYRQTVLNGKPARLEDFWPTHQVWYEIQFYPIPQGLIVCLKEISERKRVEEQLKESEYRFKVLSEATFEAVIIHQNGITLEANQSAAQLYGYTSPQELIGLSIVEHLNAESMSELQKWSTQGLDTPCEVTIIRKDGSQVPVEARYRPIEYRGQAATVVAGRDITERKQTEIILRKTQAQLHQSQKMESLGRLAGGIAHDFNNLLTGITGYTELALLEFGEEEALYSYISEIQRAAQRAATLTRQLLAFSRQQLLQPRVINLNEIVADMGKLLHRLIGEDIELELVLEPLLGEVLADPSQLEQVMINLAVNARDAMPNGGKLTIETANVELDEQYRSFGHARVKPGSYVMLVVSDTGIGMDHETQLRIFDPFFTTKEVGKGTGLGLAMVYGIVEQSGGYIWVYSEVGVGTTFKIYLPKVIIPMLVKSQVTSPTQNLKGANQSDIGLGRTVLVVEDDSVVRDLILRVLAHAGYTTLEASNGQQAWEISAGYIGKIDLVLTDMIMPQMGGRKLISQLKAYRSNLKIVGMSGYTEQSVAHHIALEQCDAFLQKPFTAIKLLSLLEEVLNITS